MPSPPEPIEDFAAALHAGGDAWDCHVHVFGAPEHYPLRPDRRYTPQATSLASLIAHAAQVRVGHLVLVQASPYGNDNRCLLDALQQLGSACRGVVSLSSQDVGDRSLSVLHAAGIRGVRINAGRATPTEELLRASGALSERLSGSSWHIELNVPGEQAVAMLRASAAGAVPVVFDHMGGLDPSHPDFRTQLSQIIAYARSDRAWFKVSGFERVCRTAEHRFALQDALIQLLETSSPRLVWGSDWPHTPLHDTAHGHHFRSVDDWAEGTALARVLGQYADRVFRENPVNLYR